MNVIIFHFFTISSLSSAGIFDDQFYLLKVTRGI